MPEPPDVSLFTRYMLENPWPLGVSLLILSAWFLWIGMREGLAKKLKVGAALGGLGAIIIGVGVAVTTSGEHARRVTKQLVQAAVEGDSIAAVDLFAHQAIFTVGSPNNPGMDIDFIRDQIVHLLDRYPIESNDITMLRSYTQTRDAATAHLACLTTVCEFPYPTVSRWSLRISRQSDGEWKIVQLTCVAINDQTPPLTGIR